MMNKYYDYTISAIGENIDESGIVEALKSLSLGKIHVEKRLNFDVFVESLPNRSIDGFTKRCAEQINAWEKNGGDWPTSDMLRSVCRDDTENNPQILANVLHDSIAGVTRKNYEAPGIVVPIILACLKES